MWKRNGTVKVVAVIVKEENPFQNISSWDSSWGGYGNYVWGYGTRAPGPGMAITPELAEAELAASIRTAIDEYEDVFRFCPVSIDGTRVHAIVRLLLYAGLPRFMRLHGMIAAIFRGDWSEAAYQLRSHPWYHDAGQKARKIVIDLRDGDPENENSKKKGKGKGGPVCEN